MTSLICSRMRMAPSMTRMGLSPLVQRPVAQLLQVDADQRVAAFQGVIEEGEGAVLLQRDQPED